MIADKLLKLFDGAALSSQQGSEALDLAQEYPNIGTYVKPLYFIVRSMDAEGDGILTVSIQDSEDGSSFTSIMSYRIQGSYLAFEDGVVPLPLVHRRYLKITTQVSEGSLAGTFDGFIDRQFDMRQRKDFEGWDYVEAQD